MTAPTEAATLAEAVRSLAARVDADEADAAEIEHVTELVHAIAAGCTRDEQIELHAALQRLEQAAAASLERLGDALRQIGTNRHAIAAFGALRPHTTGQRLRTRV